MNGELGRVGRLKAIRLGEEWQSPAAWRQRWLAGTFAVFAVFGALVAVFSSDPVHRLWGSMAACGYAAALVVLAAWRRHGADLGLAVALCGALLVPLSWMGWHDERQPEVDVVARSAVSLLRHGTPYTGAAALAATANPNSYNPYLPLMSVFGMPRALFGGGLATDPRVWFGLVFLVVFAWALRCGGARDAVRWTALIAGSPVIAFELAVGGTDVPVVAFLCLGFGLLCKQRPACAGVAFGIVAGMKSTAWPAVLVAIVLLAVTRGRRAAIRFTACSLAVAAVCVGPFLVHPRDLVQNTLLFPLGLAHVTSQASSPLPGHLIAGTGHVGHTIVIVLLALAGLAVVATLVLRPPRTVPQAVVLLAWAMTLMFVLAPSTRFGYFIYPGTLALWLLAVAADRAPQSRPVMPGSGEPPPASRTTSTHPSPQGRPAA